MKKIEAIIRPALLDAVVERLEKLGVNGFHCQEIQGHGRQKGLKEIFRGREYDLRFHLKIRLTVVVADALAEEAVKVIEESASTGEVGDGKIFVSDLTDVIRIRTRERGESAI